MKLYDLVNGLHLWYRNDLYIFIPVTWPSIIQSFNKTDSF